MATADGPRLPLSVFGPYQSLYGRLDLHLEAGRSPVLVIATGAGAGLVLGVLSKLRLMRHNNELWQLRAPVKLFYSTWSMSLLQFVTDAIPEEEIPGVSLCASLTRMGGSLAEPLGSITEGQSELLFQRHDFVHIIQGIRQPCTEVFFCGSSTVSRILEHECKKRGLLFVGSAVNG